mmetsp:Transcript_15912/g.40426  ORF Transcript_15912/g.40426 Transcript_15912/m.40426 type:complete len:270 (-) Transcript_15912:898-1707(-)
MMTSPSTPELNAMSFSGAVMAFITMSAPKRSSSLVSVFLNSGTIWARWNSAAPPPGTMPSSTAAKVAFFASSMRSLRSSSSASVAAPTLMTAMPPVSLAMRSLSFSISYTLSLRSSSFLICATRIAISSWLPASAMMVVLVGATVILRAEPSCSSTVSSNFMPRSLAMYSAPVTIAMSCSSAFRRSPKPGALTATTLRLPRSLLTTSVASASPATSSVMITSGAPALAACSRIGMIWRAVSIFWSLTSTRQLSNSHCWRSGLFTNCGEM